MYNKELFNKIINANCTLEELYDFNCNIDKIDFDQDNTFIKYYNAENVLKILVRYENKEIDDRYLAYWMNAYNWIVTAEFRKETETKEIVFKDWVSWEISYCLDSLSFFEVSDDECNLEDYKQYFIMMDKVYKNINDCRRVFAYADKQEDNEDDVILLVINYKTKEVVKIFSCLGCLNEVVDVEKVEFAELERIIENLKEQGFKEFNNNM